jgi:hypothetical protein
MAQSCPIAAGKKSGKQPSLTTERNVSQGVHAAMDDDQATFPNRVVDGPTSDKLKELRPTQYSVLPLRDISDCTQATLTMYLNVNVACGVHWRMLRREEWRNYTRLWRDGR